MLCFPMTGYINTNVADHLLPGAERWKANDTRSSSCANSRYFYSLLLILLKSCISAYNCVKSSNRKIYNRANGLEQTGRKKVNDKNNKIVQPSHFYVCP